MSISYIEISLMSAFSVDCEGCLDHHNQVSPLSVDFEFN